MIQVNDTVDCQSPLIALTLAMCQRVRIQTRQIEAAVAQLVERNGCQARLVPGQIALRDALVDDVLETRK